MTVFDLWLPIVATGLATHILCTLAWTALPHHKPEWTKIPVEDELQDLIQKQGVPAGQYIIPYCFGGPEAATPEFQQKQQKCRGMLVLWSAPVSMPRAIGSTLAFFLVAAFTIAYLASLALKPGAEFGKVVQFVTTTALLTHCAAHFPHIFWFPRKIAMELVDGVIFAVVTGLIFASLWPAA